jgi:hypothetical protein
MIGMDPTLEVLHGVLEDEMDQAAIIFLALLLATIGLSALNSTGF